MSENSQQEILEEQKKYAMKFFDYAESPIQKWLALYYNEPVKVLFPDFKDESDLISVEFDGNYYILYITEKKSVGNSFDLTTMEKSNSIKKAASLLFDAVRNTFFPIAKTITNHKEECSLLIPMFDDKTMSFELRAFNRLAMEREQCDKELVQIGVQLKRLGEQSNIKAAHKKQAAQLRKQLNEMQIRSLEKFNSIPINKVKEMDERCLELNKKLATSQRLYMILGKNAKPTEDTVAKRLPAFGLSYQDPDEDNYIDKLRDELEQ